MITAAVETKMKWQGGANGLHKSMWNATGKSATVLNSPCIRVVRLKCKSVADLDSVSESNSDSDSPAAYVGLQGVTLNLISPPHKWANNWRMEWIFFFFHMGGLRRLLDIWLSLSISSDRMELSAGMFVNYPNSIHGMTKLGHWRFIDSNDPQGSLDIWSGGRGINSAAKILAPQQWTHHGRRTRADGAM